MVVKASIQINTTDGRNFTYVRDVVNSGTGGQQYSFNADLGETYTQANGQTVIGWGTVDPTKPTVDGYILQQQSIGSSYNAVTSAISFSTAANAAVYGNGIYVVAGNDTTNTIAVSSNGITWTQKANATVVNEGIYVPELSMFVLVGTLASNGVVTSTDAGSTWTNRATVTTATWNGVDWSPTLKKFVIAGVNTTTPTNAVMTSWDGITWTGQTTPSVTLNHVIWSTYWKKFIAVGTAQTVLTSTDGNTWNTIASIPTGTWSSVVEGNNGLLVAVAATASTTAAMYSLDGGATWTAVTTTNVAGGWTDVFFYNGQFLAGAANTTNSILQSWDGKTWTLVATPSFTVRNIISDGSKLISVGGTGTTFTMFSYETGGYVYGDFLTLMSNWKSGTTELLQFPESSGNTDTISRLNQGESKFTTVKNYYGVKRTNISSIIMNVNTSLQPLVNMGNR